MASGNCAGLATGSSEWASGMMLGFDGLIPYTVSTAAIMSSSAFSHNTPFSVWFDTVDMQLEAVLSLMLMP